MDKAKLYKALFACCDKEKNSIRPILKGINHELVGNQWVLGASNGHIAVLAYLPAGELPEDLNGRVRDEQWGPRTIDIDLIRIGDRQREDEHLTLPHPRAHERAFVLVPWLEADPSAELPGHGPVAELLADLGTDGVDLVEGATIHLP